MEVGQLGCSAFIAFQTTFAHGSHAHMHAFHRTFTWSYTDRNNGVMREIKRTRD